MRLLVLGVDAHGSSCLTAMTEVVPRAVAGVPGVAVARLFSTDSSPPPPCPAGLGLATEDRLAPGLVQWYVVEHEPAAHDERSAATELHHRNAIDLVVVLDGSADLLLMDGAHPVSAGDCIVMAGIDHGMRAGIDGCRLMSFAIGTPPPAAVLEPGGSP